MEIILFSSNVVVYDNCIIGLNVIIHANTTIGSNGFYFKTEDYII
ncbi:MAG: hypothetical protein IPJ32_16650 [Sphingobacteriaceae bacterium]|nr:hypothetical protein [Sphingobacteriaceae bacterium]